MFLPNIPWNPNSKAEKHLVDVCWLRLVRDFYWTGLIKILGVKYMNSLHHRHTRFLNTWTEKIYVTWKKLILLAISKKPLQYAKVCCTIVQFQYICTMTKKVLKSLRVSEIYAWKSIYFFIQKFYYIKYNSWT